MKASLIRHFRGSVGLALGLAWVQAGLLATDAASAVHSSTLGLKQEVLLAEIRDALKARS